MLLFSEYPGRRERHLLRKRNNPLFPEAERKIESAALQEAQRLDHEELVGFLEELQRLMQRAMTLQPNEDSAVILELKEQLDRAYEQASGLADNQAHTKEGLRQLVDAVMRAVRTGAEGDPTALRELEDEAAARALHYRLLEHALVADLLAPDSPIRPEELAPTLLSADSETLGAVLELFGAEQCALLAQDAERLLQRLPDPPATAKAALEKIRAAG